MPQILLDSKLQVLTKFSSFQFIQFPKYVVHLASLRPSQQSYANTSPVISSTGEYYSTLSKLLQSPLASNSLDIYNRAWSVFREFCTSVLGTSIDPPVSGEIICLFVAYLHHIKRAPSTISTYLSKIGHVHKLLNFADPTKNYVVSKTCHGIIQNKTMLRHSTTHHTSTFR